jgi:PAS domain-containing protein
LGQVSESLQTEIAQRERTERALQDARAQFVSLIESLSLHVIRKDTKGRFTYASPSFCTLVGKPLEADPRQDGPRSLPQGTGRQVHAGRPPRHRIESGF